MIIPPFEIVGITVNDCLISLNLNLNDYLSLEMMGLSGVDCLNIMELDLISM